MEVIIQPTPEAATNIAARLIADLLRQKPGAVPGLAWALGKETRQIK